MHTGMKLLGIHVLSFIRYCQIALRSTYANLLAVDEISSHSKSKLDFNLFIHGNWEEQNKLEVLEIAPPSVD